MKFKNYLLSLLVLVISFFACNSDDDDPFTAVPERDRAEQYAEDIAAIEEYLQTHFYNYEEFEANSNDPNFKIVFDTIAGVNEDKIPLIEREEEINFIMVEDGISDVQYKLYYLNVRGGEGKTPTIADSTFVEYKGIELDGSVFDSSPNPTWIDLANSIEGYRDISVLFSGASPDLIDNGDGTSSFQEFGVGAMFIPSGLGYYSTPPATVSFYAPLIFTINMYRVNDFTDHDQDGIPSYLEDIDGSGNVRNDDNDVNGVPNYIDADDDGDGSLTIDELEFNDYTTEDFPSQLLSNEYLISELDTDNDGELDTFRTVVLIDSNSDGTPDYLDSSVTTSDDN